MVTSSVQRLADQVGTLLVSKGLQLRTAESCTGGLIAATCTDISGSSLWFDRGWVTYSNAAKNEMLGVDPGLIAQNGAVSEPVVLAMARGARAMKSSVVTVAVSGVAGPLGGTPEKPVGTVWIAWDMGHIASAQRFHFSGDRLAVRWSTVEHALTGLSERLSAAPSVGATT